jgi:hypothetical protein
MMANFLLHQCGQTSNTTDVMTMALDTRADPELLVVASLSCPSFISSMGEFAPSHSASVHKHEPKLVDMHDFSQPGNVQGILGKATEGTSSMVVQELETESTTTVEQSDDASMF